MTNKSAIIHKTAIIDDGAIIGNNVYIGPYCCVGSNVKLCDNVRLESHVVISGDTTIGESSSIFPFASLGTTPQDLKYNNEQSKLEIGKNTIIREYVTANLGTEGGGMVTKIGDNCLIMAYCHIAHDCIIGNNVILVNGVNLSGHVFIDDFAIIGGLSAVKQFIRIGRHAMIGGCTGVERDVIPYGLIRSDRQTTIKGLNIIGLKRRGFSIDEIKTMIEAFHEIFGNISEDVSFTKSVENAEKSYAGNKYVAEIIDFIKEKSKNPICTSPANCVTLDMMTLLPIIQSWAT
ncbi:MAG: acyl-ACP--UDP-N-acetylglucosamine O-acyltransferase [Sphingobacteriia bacterium]|nr:acyl-ACP--UDP-N-acetylglucosamine O-acyltransferase [Sphingobacteriia bacterium]